MYAMQYNQLSCLQLNEVRMNSANTWLPGVLREDGTVVLDYSPSISAGPVEVLIRPGPAAPVNESWWDFIQRARAEMLAGGYVFRTKEEIDADRARQRAMDEERDRNLEESHSNRE